MNHTLATQHELLLPGVRWATHPLWQEALWSGTAYQFDRRADSPPVMALLFDNPEKGRELFKSWTDKNGNYDELEEIRITIIEGDMPNLEAGYWVHICADPENSLVRATAEGAAIDAATLGTIGQSHRMEFGDAIEPMLLRFKELFKRHGEFLFAPASPRGDGRRWVDLQRGIVKRAIHFQQIEDFRENSAEHRAKCVKLPE